MFSFSISTKPCGGASAYETLRPLLSGFILRRNQYAGFSTGLGPRPFLRGNLQAVGIRLYMYYTAQAYFFYYPAAVLR